jgi:resuscitation-promoting factor RpfB
VSARWRCRRLRRRLPGRRGRRGQSTAVVAALAGLALAVAGHSASHATGSGGGGGHARAAVPAGPAASRSAVALGEQLAAARGWTGAQWDCLAWLWTRESGWNTYALNTQSGAYGIPQSLPASKMAAAGADWQTDPATQIRWGLAYIAATYGTPCAAWAHEEASSWY